MSSDLQTSQPTTLSFNQVHCSCLLPSGKEISGGVNKAGFTDWADALGSDTLFAGVLLISSSSNGILETGMDSVTRTSWILSTVAGNGSLVSPSKFSNDSSVESSIYKDRTPSVRCLFSSSNTALAASKGSITASSLMILPEYAQHILPVNQTLGSNGHPLYALSNWFGQGYEE